MKRIVKNLEPEEFTAWKALEHSPENVGDWKPTWSNFQKPQKPLVHRALLQEQGFLCCYCGREIDTMTAEVHDLEPKESHIEHFIPGEEATDLHSLDYANFHASCLNYGKPRSTQKTVEEPTYPRFCGVAKDNWFDEVLTVSPTEERVEERFWYDAQGHIHAKDGDAGAQATIEKLALDHSILDDLRKKRIDGLLFDEDQLPLPLQDIQVILAKVQRRDSFGRFGSFPQVIESVGRTLAASGATP